MTDTKLKEHITSKHFGIPADLADLAENYALWRVQTLMAQLAEAQATNEALLKANLDCVDHFNQMRDDLSEAQTLIDANRKQKAEPVVEPVLQIAEALRVHGMSLIKTTDGYDIVRLGDIKAQSTSPPSPPPRLVEPVVEPVAYQFRMRAEWLADWGLWTPCSKEQYEMYNRVPRLHDWIYEARPLYAAPQPPSRVPLFTDDEIDAALPWADVADLIESYNARQVRAACRAIEALVRQKAGLK